MGKTESSKYKDKGHTQQELYSIQIEKLKCLKNVEIDFTKTVNIINEETKLSESHTIVAPMVAIMAPNGYGKSTILHALYCSYTDVKNEDANNKFKDFFPPIKSSDGTTGTEDWTGSSFTINYSYGVKGKTEIESKKFTKITDRWCRYESRPQRWVRYIGINTCVPFIEKEKKSSYILKKIGLTDSVYTKIREKAALVMNREYDDYNKQTSEKKELIGVKYNGIDYTSVSMGAGEQRIFYILKEVYTAPKYALILIDEIDLLLHEDALLRLLDVINERAKAYNLQVIFTTHAYAILQKDYIEFRHLYQSKEKTICFDKTYPDFIWNLTGKASDKPLTIYVEDDVAKYLVLQLCEQKKMKKYVQIEKFGSWQNGISAVCGLVLDNDAKIDDKLFVVDGDFCCDTYEKWENQAEKIITKGKDLVYEEKRKQALTHVKKFCIDSAKNPEEYYREVILKNDKTTDSEIYEALERIKVVEDKHDYFNIAINYLGLEKEVGLYRIIGLLSKTPEWEDIMKDISKWLDSKKEIVMPTEYKALF